MRTKQESRRQRQQSFKDPHLRRHNLLREITAEVSPELLMPLEAFLVLFGRLDTAKGIIARAQRRLVTDRLQSNFRILDLTAGSNPQSCPPPPASSLSRLNRSSVHPQLVPAEPPIIAVGMSLPEITATVREAKANGVPTHQLLDLFACASGLPWTDSATMLLAQKIIHRPMDCADIEASEAARFFWRLYFCGQLEFAAGAKLGQVPNWRGAWALFSRQLLDHLLPGSILPDHCQRAEFLTRYATAEEPALYIYSFTGLPLCTHPFPPRYNPLIYGKPPAIRLQP